MSPGKGGPAAQQGGCRQQQPEGRSGSSPPPHHPQPGARERICRAHGTISPLIYRRFFPAWNSVSCSFRAQRAGVGWSSGRCSPSLLPQVRREITQFIFSGCRMPFPLHSSSLRYLITMLPIHMSGHFTCVRAP